MPLRLCLAIVCLFSILYQVLVTTYVSCVNLSSLATLEVVEAMM